MRGDIVLVVKLVNEDMVDHGIEKRGVSTGPDTRDTCRQSQMSG